MIFIIYFYCSTLRKNKKEVVKLCKRIRYVEIDQDGLILCIRYNEIPHSHEGIATSQRLNSNVSEQIQESLRQGASCQKVVCICF